ncbi:MAG: hypothetical protein LBG73_08710 [Spirochaetaceae bacterium]|nr:hypothetical protein [Spirochaetaceae bacterium]
MTEGGAGSAGKPVISLLAVFGTLAFLFTACPESDNGNSEPGFTITGVTVNPQNATAVKGQSKSFTAVVQMERSIPVRILH